MHPVFIVGCGYTGLRLARRLVRHGHAVRGSATRTATLAAVSAAGAEAQPLDLDAPLPRLEVADHLIYYLVPPPSAGMRDPRLERFLGAIGRPHRFIYLSTTGVYGDRGGARVDEDTPPAPESERGARRLAAETALREWADATATPWCILRVPGIYGPGRLPLERLRRGEPAIEPGEATPGNRIHVDDLVTACTAAGASPRAAGRIYNVTDGSDDSLTSYLQRVARIAGLPSPPLISREDAEHLLSANAWSFLRESRRVQNRRMLDELGVALAFHDLDAGIRASLAAPA